MTTTRRTTTITMTTARPLLRRPSPARLASGVRVEARTDQASGIRPWDQADEAGGELVTGFSTNWVDGEPFLEALRDRSLADRLVAFGGLLDAVGYLHRSGLLHLDVKPDNALYVADSGPVLLDVGSARPVDAVAGQAGGTVGYASPEVLAGQAASVASDMYSLGAVLYELVTGHRPYGELHGRELRQAVSVEEPVPVRAVASSTPRGLASLIERMLARDPGRRPRGVDDVALALGQAGFPVLRWAPGAPPFFGRVREVLALERLLVDERAPVVALVGPRGSGRSRLARRAVGAIAERAGASYADLSRADDPGIAMLRLFTTAGSDAAGSRSPWEAMRARFQAHHLSR